MRDPREDQTRAAVEDARREAKRLTRQSNGQAMFVGRPDAAPDAVRPMLFEIGRALDAHELGVCEHVAETPSMAYVPQWVPNRGLCGKCYADAMAEWLDELSRSVAAGQWMACNCCGVPMLQVFTVLAPVGPWLLIALVCQECTGR